jgi:hypothetical protein
MTLSIDVWMRPWNFELLKANWNVGSVSDEAGVGIEVQAYFSKFGTFIRNQCFAEFYIIIKLVEPDGLKREKILTDSSVYYRMEVLFLLLFSKRERFPLIKLFKSVFIRANILKRQLINIISNPKASYCILF